MAGILGIGTSGLLAYQTALNTVGHNVANANTEGYSRQRVQLGTQTPEFQGVGYVGTGVKVQTVERVYDEFLVEQVQTYTSSAKYSEILAEQSSLIDEMLADPDVGLTPAMEDFFSDLEAVSNDPTLVAAREALLAQSDTLVDRFAHLNRRMEDLREQVNDKVTNVTSEINGLAEQIAQLNYDIFNARGTATPNDMLDARDQLLTELAEKVAITTVEQDNGAVNVFYGKGQTLVINFDANTLVSARNAYDARQVDVGMNLGGGGLVDVSNQITGGELGALMDFRSNVLTEAQNSLGSLATAFATTFNEQHRLGQDLQGNLGTDFFNVGGLEVLPNTNNSAASTAVITATLTDVAELDASELELSYSAAGGYTLRNLSDGSSVNFAAAALPFTATDYGFTLSQTGAIQDGDRFLIRPGRRGAEDLSLALTDPNEVAAAAPVRAQADILNNTGTGEIGPGVVLDTALLPAATLTLTYDQGNNRFNVFNGAVLVDTTNAYTSGGAITSTGATLNGVELRVSGNPADGDSFTLEANTNGVGDNRNALLMSDLQNQTQLAGGSASYTDFYGGLVADVGVQTRQARVAESTQSTLLSNAQNARDSVSGVNLDEEAANLVKFQQAYQAASQVIVTANTMFQSLISALRG